MIDRCPQCKKSLKTNGYHKFDPAINRYKWFCNLWCDEVNCHFRWVFEDDFEDSSIEIGQAMHNWCIYYPFGCKNTSLIQRGSKLSDSPYLQVHLTNHKELFFDIAFESLEAIYDYYVSVRDGTHSESLFL